MIHRDETGEEMIGPNTEFLYSLLRAMRAMFPPIGFLLFVSVLLLEMNHEPAICFSKLI